MISSDLGEMAALLGAELHGDPVAFAGVGIDTRRPLDGALYVALRGDRFDGNEFVAQAFDAGAVAAIVERVTDRLPHIRVEDTRIALGRIAAWWRSRFEGPVIGVTGSNGKTTVKELIARILTVGGPALATAGNLNNDIGVPLTLFRLQPEHRAAVCEMGANHPGEIAYLAAIARPDVGLVTNASAAHLEGFGSIEGVARAKGEMFAGLAADGTAVVNADDQYAVLWRQLSGERRIVSFGIDAPADVRARDIAAAGSAATGFELCTPAGDVPLRLPLPGRHNVMNALAAAAACLAAGISLDDVRAGLESATAISGRLRVASALNGATLIDDCYNANPASLRAGIEYLTGLGGEPWLVFGDMGELGADREAIHREVGELARKSGVVRMFAVGDLARHAARSFGQAAEWFETPDDLAAQLRAEIHDGVNVLIKASRAMGLESVVRAIEVAGSDNTAEGV